MKKAIALKYPEDAPAPFILAKEKNFLAEQMIKIAESKHIPVIKDSMTANILSLYEINSFIPEETYQVIAKIFAFIRSNAYE